MKQPKSLTLRQAINATKNPLVRPGDLRMVQCFHQLIGHPDYLNGEMHNPYVPSIRDISAMRFPQPETESALRELYANGGRLESATHLSDLELALLGNGWAGIVRPSGMVGSWGDPSEFEKDLLEAIALIPAEHPESVRFIVREVVLRLHKKYAPDAEIGRAQAKAQAKKASKRRSATSDDKRTLEDVIRTLSREHYNAKPAEVWPHLRASLEEWSCEKVIEMGTGNSRRYRYQRPNAFGDVGKTISYDLFRKRLKTIRNEKSGI